MKSVTVLLSTYNGQKYLKEQIESLLNQKQVDLQVLIRDDGSKDNTSQILKEISDSRVSYYLAANKGVVRSFMELIENAPDSDYYAFCDQDDYWLEEKLISAIKKLETIDNDICLYCSANTLVDENLKPFRENNKTASHRITYGGVLMKCCSIGCTYVFSREALLYIRRKALNTNVMMHDAWVLRVIATVGEICYDNNSHILYRQHGGNVVGSTNSKIAKWKGRLRRFGTYLDNTRGNAISDLYDTCKNDMKDSKKLSILEDFYKRKKSIISRIRLCSNSEVRCFSKVDTVILKLFILFGIY